MSELAGTRERPRVRSTSLSITGLSLLFVAAGMAVCAVVDGVMGGDAVAALLASAAITGVVGGGLWFATAVPGTIPPRAVFVAVAVSWLAMSAMGALPYLLSGTFETLDDALFESISGFTCSGSTVLTTDGFETTDPGILFWRQLTQWFGGMGIIVLAVAVLPFLGVGGLELISAEAPGPTTDRLAPRVSETAKRLWIVYLGFTMVSSVALLLTGLTLYDAVAHALALVSTGGFSTRAASIGHYDSVDVESVVIAGMVIGGASFTLHYDAVRGRLGSYVRNSEFRVYLAGIVGGTALVTALLVDDGIGVGDALRNALFNVVTLATSCGFGNAQGAGSLGDFVVWVPAAQVVLFFFLWSGGMTGSTSGGMKVLRAQVMGRLAWREILRARNPRAVLPVKQGGDPVDEEIVSRIAGFVLLYFLIVAMATVVLGMLGSAPIEALSGSVSAMGNMGPALGEAGPSSSFLVYSRPERGVLALLMLIGRLEVFPMVLFLVAGARSARSLTLGHRAGRERRPVLSTTGEDGDFGVRRPDTKP